MKRYKFCYIAFFILIFVLQSCATKPPENPDNICLIFQEKRSWYKAAIRSEKRWKIPPYVLISFVHQESSFKSDARPEREKILGVIPWFRPSTAVGYSQALTKTWDDYKDETGNTRANRKNFSDSADFIGWYASKGYYQGFEKTDARSLYLAYHEGYGGFEKKSYRKKQWLIKVADRVQARSTKYQKQYWGCAKELKKKKFIFF
ncbi:transglycosylase SLT domain-containing protein [Gammaproteobacteria bacterium]|nr:transglycosylase SLT domain-containing protein [Gammaproteobacteria bacterium]|tara:strand:+ start:592 stop:1203 length:612 start_codon:yes stop_codon:yes gene_type:complete